jgi:DNA-directed RNA polymerase specialized sigma24 family protein
MAKKREIVKEFTTSTSSITGHRYGATEQLMQLSPHEEPVLPSLEATAELKDAVGEAIGNLSEEEQFIFNALFVECLSLRGLAVIVSIPKTSLARRRDKIRRKLMLDLTHDERIQGWMHRGF